MDTPKFNLSKVNITFWIIIALFVSLRFLAGSEMSSYRIGELVGQLTAYLLMPMAVAWVVWRIAGRSQRAGSIAFNVVLALVVLGQLAEHGRKVQEQETLRAFESDKEAYKQTFRESEDPEVINAAYKDYTDSIQSGLENLAAGSSGDQQAFFNIMRDFVKEAQTHSMAWQDAFDLVQSERILDFSRLHAEGEFEYQIGALKTYVEQTKAYQAYNETMLENLRSRLSALGENNKYATGAMKGAASKYAVQKPIFDPLFDHHLKYGTQMIQLLQFLEEKQSSWSYENGELLFDSDATIEQYDRIFEPLLEQEQRINELTTKLLEVV